MIIAAALAALLFRFLAGAASPVAGLAASASLLAMPRLFFHAHLSSLDLPSAAASFGSSLRTYIT